MELRVFEWGSSVEVTVLPANLSQILSEPCSSSGLGNFLHPTERHCLVYRERFMLRNEEVGLVGPWQAGQCPSQTSAADTCDLLSLSLEPRMWK